MACHLGRAGVDHLIVDKAHYPRAHVGESLSHSSTSLLKEMDFLEAMDREGYIVKRGTSWTSWQEQGQVDISLEGLGEPAHAYQVDRAKFDEMLLRRAREQGSRVFSGAEVEHVDFNRRGAATGITLRLGGSKFTLKSNLIVDASGRQTILGRQLRLLKEHPQTPQFTVHSWFSGVERRKDRDGRLHTHLPPADREGLGVADSNKRSGDFSRRRVEP